MNISILWAPVSGYMLPCWNALASKGHHVKVLAPRVGSSSNTDYQVSTARSVEVQFVSEKQIYNRLIVNEFMQSADPQITIISGWWNPAFRWAALRSDAPFIVGSDNPYRGVIQAMGLRIRHGRFLRKASAVAVPGERGFQLMIRAGVSADRVFQPLYGVQGSNVAGPTPVERLGFLFTGQLIERKGIRELMLAYGIYRDETDNPMPLVVAGLGPLVDLVIAQDGVEYLGFVQPQELIKIREKLAFLVLPSTEDAWPLAVVEAANAGMGILCSFDCGSAVEIVRTGWNGWKFPGGNVAEIVSAMHWAEMQVSQNQDIHQRSHELSNPYTADQWAFDWNRLIEKLTSTK